MREDAGCDFPCGGEPMMCGTCPDFGTTDSGADNQKCSRCGKPGTLTHGFCDSCVDEIAFGDLED